MVIRSARFSKNVLKALPLKLSSDASGSLSYTVSSSDFFQNVHFLRNYPSVAYMPLLFCAERLVIPVFFR